MLSPIPLTDFTAEVLSIYDSQRYARKTRLRMRQVLEGVSSLDGVRTTADLTTPTMARFVMSRGPLANPNTTNGLLGALRAACNYAVEREYLQRPPAWRRLWLRPRAATLNPPLTYAQAARLLVRLRQLSGDWCGHRLYALYCTILMTGLRGGEAHCAQIGDVDLPGSRLAVVPRQRRLKTAASARPVPLPKALRHVLREWLPQVDDGENPWLFPGVERRGPWRGGPLGHRSIDQLQAVARSVGIERITWHGLRHTFGTQSVLKFGVPLWVVQRVLRHTDLRTTQGYLHLDDIERLTRGVEHIDYPPED